MPTDDVHRGRSTEQANTPNSSRNAERSSGNPEMRPLVDIVSSSLDGDSLNPSIGVAGVLFCVGLLLLRVA